MLRLWLSLSGAGPAARAEAGEKKEEKGEGVWRNGAGLAA